MSNLPQEDYDYAEVIGRNLQRLINERGTTQAAIAQKLGIARTGDAELLPLRRSSASPVRASTNTCRAYRRPVPGISCASHGLSESPPMSCCV